MVNTHSHEEIERWKRLRPIIVYVTPEEQEVIRLVLEKGSAPIPELSKILEELVKTSAYR